MANHQGKLNEHILALAHRRDAFGVNAALAEADTLRLYEALADNPLSAQRLARKTGTDAGAVRKWLGAQVTQGHLQYDAARQQYWMTEQQAFAIAHEPGLYFVADAFRIWRRTRPFAR
ncbi:MULTISPECIES: hypothetical protein [Paraburkholderia]|uniref:S-adenosylmethionine-dependent methyltransferase Rv2258c-like winged HTH domain-containing protein n=1 Tax=Paraburkholderia podalyriae TaxID=1938811 RepID=A0ABR7PW17_9BURK|nr:hypothetical protein [Paraburkholderia podalyriae]MBC8750482.1 hypothetical protein [Paraburkholderia podalyriae]